MPAIYFTLRTFADPVVFLLFFMVIALWLLRKPGSGAARIGWWCSLLAVGFLYVFCLSPSVCALAYLLEKDYPPIKSEHLEDIEVVVVLGAGVTQGGTRNEPQLVDVSAMRFLYGIQKFQQSGAQRLVFSGGRGFGPASNAEVMGRIASAFGISKERLVLESNSRTTWDQAIEVGRLLEEKNATVGLVTSAIHMRRSLQTFSRFFPSLVALPSDYLCLSLTWSLVPSSENLEKVNRILHEYLGLIVYSLRGWWAQD